MKLPNKFADEVLSYQVDWSERLASGEVITAVLVKITSGTITVGPPASSWSGNVVIFWLSAGTVAEVIQGLIEVTTSSGEIIAEPFSLYISG